MEIRDWQDDLPQHEQLLIQWFEAWATGDPKPLSWTKLAHETLEYLSEQGYPVSFAEWSSVDPLTGERFGKPRPTEPPAS